MWLGHFWRSRQSYGLLGFHKECSEPHRTNIDMNDNIIRDEPPRETRANQNVPRGTSTSEEPMRVFALVANHVALSPTYTAVSVITAALRHFLCPRS
jgi:hypothetical protein